MAIYDFFLSRNGAASTPENYVGHTGRLFYNSNNGVIKISDGVTPGGLSIPYTIASDTVVGGVKAGPGVVINSEGQILIDSAGLDFSFGDIESITGQYEDSSSYAVLRTINLDEDLYFQSSGSGSINVIGEFRVYKTNGNVSGAIAVAPIFTVKSDGQIQMLVPGADSNEGALTIVGGLDGVFQSPVNPGVMLHITGIAGSPGVPSRIYNDAQNAFGAFVTRRYNGTAASPTAVLADEEILRLSGTAHNGTLIPGTANQRIVYRALGNQSVSNAGGAIELWATPLNDTTLAKIATVNSAGIALESGKVLTGNVTVGAGNTLNVTGATVTGLTLGGLNPADVAGTMTGTTIKSTVTGSSLTSVGTLTDLSVTNTINGSINGTAGIATTVTLVATNTTDATHYLTFVDAATGNENVRTDTGLTYNPGTNTLGADTGAFTTFTGQFHRTVRNAGTIGAGGTLTIDFSTDSLVYCVWGDGMTLAYSNFTAGSVVKVMARKAAGTGVDTFSLGGLTAAQVSSGSTTSPNVSADTTAFIELTCTSTTIGSVYAKL